MAGTVIFLYNVYWSSFSRILQILLIFFNVFYTGVTFSYTRILNVIWENNIAKEDLHHTLHAAKFLLCFCILGRMIGAVAVTISFELNIVSWGSVLCHILVYTSTCHSTVRDGGCFCWSFFFLISDGKWKILIGVWSENDFPFAKAVDSIYFLAVLTKKFHWQGISGQLLFNLSTPDIE